MDLGSHFIFTPLNSFLNFIRLDEFRFKTDLKQNCIYMYTYLHPAGTIRFNYKPTHAFNRPNPVSPSRNRFKREDT